MQGKIVGYPLHSHISPSLPLPCAAVCHQIPNALYYNRSRPTRTPRKPVLDLTDTPADINGLVRFAGRPNLVSARVPSHSVFTVPLLRWTHAAFIIKAVDVEVAGFSFNKIIRRHIPEKCNVNLHHLIPYQIPQQISRMLCAMSLMYPSAYHRISIKGKSQFWTGPEGSTKLRLTDFKTAGT